MPSPPVFRATRPALQVQRELLAALETAQGPAARETLRAEASLASLVRDRGDSEQSMAMLAGVIERLEQAPEPYF